MAEVEATIRGLKEQSVDAHGTTAAERKANGTETVRLAMGPSINWRKLKMALQFKGALHTMRGNDRIQTKSGFNNWDSQTVL